MIRCESTSTLRSWAAGVGDLKQPPTSINTRKSNAIKARAQVIYFRLVRVACQTISDFYFPRTKVATYSPRLPTFWIVVNLVRIVYVLLSTKRNYKAYGVAGPICKFIYLYPFLSVLWLAQVFNQRIRYYLYVIIVVCIQCPDGCVNLFSSISNYQFYSFACIVQYFFHAVAHFPWLSFNVACLAVFPDHHVLCVILFMSICYASVLSSAYSL